MYIISLYPLNRNTKCFSVNWMEIKLVKNSVKYLSNHFELSFLEGSSSLDINI